MCVLDKRNNVMQRHKDKKASAPHLKSNTDLEEA